MKPVKGMLAWERQKREGDQALKGNEVVQKGTDLFFYLKTEGAEQSPEK